MSLQSPWERCRSYVACQLQNVGGPSHAHHGWGERPLVTISRQSGAGGLAIANQLAEFLDQHLPPPNCHWTVFDRNLVEQALEEHHLPKTLARYLPERRISAISDTIEDLLGVHPPVWTLVHQTTETILHLAELGYVILVDRAATMITARFPRAVHSRVIGSLERRAARLSAERRVSVEAATALARWEDRGRQRYLRQHFGRDIDDPLAYHLVVNTDRLTHPEAARLIGEVVLQTSAVDVTAMDSRLVSMPV